MFFEVQRLFKPNAILRKTNDEDFDMVISSLDKFMKTVDYVQEIRLIGGEPLMYRRVAEVAKHILEYKNFGQLKVKQMGQLYQMMTS